jgi:integrase
MSVKNVCTRRFRVGRVTLYLRGRTWYLRYHEAGRRRQVRAAPCRKAATQLAAQVNAQLEAELPAATSFEPITPAELRQQWLDHHEHVLRSAVSTIDRYRSATEHLLNFVRDVQPLRIVAHFRPAHAEAYARYLRQLQVAPNGHPNTAKRRLRDKGVKFALEVSRSLFTFAIKRRHLPPYTENPFTVMQVERIPVEDATRIMLLDADQEVRFLQACDEWQLPVFATLMFTGMRPGELTHLLVEDLDLESGWLVVRNKPDLGWRVKTRNERRIPLLPELRELLAQRMEGRRTGPVFLRRRCTPAAGAACGGGGSGGKVPPLALLTRDALAERLRRSPEPTAASITPASVVASPRRQQRRTAAQLWSSMGAVPETLLRNEFMRLTRNVNVPEMTAPKTLRHLFATWLQEANADPLIRNQLMGHAPAVDLKGRGPLGMTGVYSHATPDTIRRQLEAALRQRPAAAVIRRWLRARGRPLTSVPEVWLATVSPAATAP